MRDDSGCLRAFYPFPVAAALLGLLSGLVIVAQIVAAQPLNALPQPVKRLRGRTVLEKFLVAPSGTLSYELSLTPCTQPTCPFQVRLIEGNRVYGTLSLDWRSVPTQPVKTTVDASSGVGDPLQRQWEMKAWETGIENRSISLTARVIALTPHLNGLLVHQRAGFEHLKRRHYLFVAVGRKLVRAWTGSEGQGPTWSTVELTESFRDGAGQFVYFTGFQYPSDDEPDSVEFTVYHWNPHKKLIAPASASLSSIVALIAGTFDTAPQARAARQQHADCLKDFLVLSPESLPQLPKGKVALAAISANTALAERAIASCPPDLKIQIVKLRPQQ